MFRSHTPIVLAAFAVGLLAVPAAFAKSGDHRTVRIQGVCTQQSTSKLKLSREDRGIEVEFQVDQNRNGVPWKVSLSRNGKQITSFTARTRAPSGSFEIRRVVAGRLDTDRITAVATRASGESCTADSAKAKTAASPVASDDHGQPSVSQSAPASSNDPVGHDAGDDHGRHSGSHA